MSGMRKLSVACGVVAVFCFLPATPSYAYIDPNSGGLLFQLIAPLIAIVSAYFLLAKEKLVRWWKRIVHALLSGKR